MSPISRLAIAFALVPLLLPAPLHAASTEKSLQKCQVTARKETDKYLAKRRKALGQCLTRVSQVLVQNGAPTPADAAGACARQLAKVIGLEEKMRTKIAARCDPLDASHTLPELRGETAVASLAIGQVDRYCGAYGGDGTLDAAEWLDCLVTSANCAANASTAAQVPRALEYLARLRPEIAALPPDATTTAALAVLDAIDAAIEGRIDDDVAHFRCGPAGVLASGQTTAFQADANDGIAGPVDVPDDGTLLLGAPLRFEDNGDGTVTDVTTGLMWEKKGDDGGLHDQDLTLFWTSETGLQETLWDWLADVNAEGGTGLAGFDDWRIPNVRELATLVDYGRAGLTIDPAFADACVAACAPSACSCTRPFRYWTSSTDAASGSFAWTVDFGAGIVDSVQKISDRHTRAVRGGH